MIQNPVKLYQDVASQHKYSFRAQQTAKQEADGVINTSQTS